MNLIRKIIDWFDPEESTPEKLISLKQLTKIPEKIFEFDGSKRSGFNLFSTFNKISEIRHFGIGLVNGIVSPSNGISRIELLHNGIEGIEIPKHRCVEKKTNVYVYEIGKNNKLKIVKTYEIDCVYFDSPVYPGHSSFIKVYDKQNEEYKDVKFISTTCSTHNWHKLLNEYRVWEQRDFQVATRPGGIQSRLGSDTSAPALAGSGRARSGTCFENDRLIISEIRLFSTQYKSKPINLKPIKSLFRKRYKNKRKILSKYLYKDVIGIICSY